MDCYSAKVYIINLNQTQYEKNKITDAACNDPTVASCFLMVL
jgi:hypothetical protein